MSDLDVDNVQGLALTGYDSDFARHFILGVVDADAARRFVGAMLAQDRFSFGPARDPESKPLVDIGFTYRGLEALNLPARLLGVLAARSPSFASGVARQALERLGDCGASAVDGWDRCFATADAHVWIAAHADDSAALDRLAGELQQLSGEGFRGWDRPALCAAHLANGAGKRPKGERRVHFGYRDGVTRPSILQPNDGRSVARGELLLGHDDASGVDHWCEVDQENMRFFRDASFGILRKIEQHREKFDQYIATEVAARKGEYPFVTDDWLKAKLCGRWPSSGAIVRPGEHTDPGQRDDMRYDFEGDPTGVGCPYGAHIRRANPRADAVVGRHPRTLFRRGMPYSGEQGGLMGVFFCARIENQFEGLVGEWLEKRPLGPRSSGEAKDPLVGNHDDVDAELHIPLEGEPPLKLPCFRPFVQTRGTLYALFPGRRALEMIAGTTDGRSLAPPSPATSSTVSAKEARLAPAARPDLDRLEAGGAPADRFCDVVMEGGITSGIIYATAVAELAKHYRFKNIGGSSIGAFAAALTAAAEYRRRFASDAGFVAFAELPRKLAETDSESKTLLERLFIPQPGTKRLFAVFLAGLRRDSALQSVQHAITEALRQYAGWIWSFEAALFLLVAGLFVTTVPECRGVVLCAGAIGIPLALALALWPAIVLVALTAVILGIVSDFARHVVPNGFGLCRGWQPKEKADDGSPPSRDALDARVGGEDPEARTVDLAAFLHTAIQGVSGREVDKLPLTFGDLWKAPGSPAEVLGYPETGVGARSINLEVYATNLSHGRPYRFPLDAAASPAESPNMISEDMGRLFFVPAELEAYFPKTLVDYLTHVSKRYEPVSDEDPPADAPNIPCDLRELPAAELPIVVAVRLAMSFPLLISAVKLWAIDHQDGGLKPCWMSDGGLCSNFPIHLFDAFIPRWPTFGISLESVPEYVEPMVNLPRLHRDGRADSWYRGIAEGSALGRLGHFILGIWFAAWRWNDSTMMRMPGVRDRVVQVRLKKGEGGVNISMSDTQIHAIAARGREAGQAFVDKFASSPDGWNEHRWVRFNALLIQLRERITGTTQAANLGRHGAPLRTLIQRSRVEPPLQGKVGSKPWPSEKPLELPQVNELVALLDALQRVEKAVDAIRPTHPFCAVPRPSLRSRHPT